MTDLFDDIDLSPATGEEPPEETPPEEPDPTDNLPKCDVCGTPIEWSGRGRRPKKCTEHKTRTSSRESTGTPVAGRRSAKQEARLAQLVEDLTAEMATFGGGLAMALPTTGVVIVSRAEMTARALVRVAQDNPAILAALETVGKIAPAAVLGETGIKVGTALLVDLGRVSPDAFLPKMTGVSDIWHEINDGTQEGSTTDEYMKYRADFGLPEIKVPPRFERVG